MVVVDSETPVPPEYAERPRRARRLLRRFLAVGSAWVALTTLVVLALGAAASTGVASGSGVPSLPDRVAGYSMLTQSVRDQPAGRAVALYRFGNDEWRAHDWQLLALGADRDSYRRVRNDTGYENDQTLLAPDGQHAMVVEDHELHRIDLLTGRERSYRLVTQGHVRLLAVSSDGARIAYAAGVFGHGARPDPGTLTILELSTGITSVVPGLPSVDAAAFAPDSRRIAVQGVLEIAIVTLDGRRVGVVPTPPLMGLVSNVGWSPDGRLLALRSQETQTSSRTTLALFLSVTGGGALRVERNPAGVDEELLGWTAPDRVLTLRSREGYSDIGRVIEELSLAGGSRRVVTRFDTGNSCERLLSDCRTQGVRLAQGLLQSLTSRTAGRPDRGPWPIGLRVAVVIGVELVLLGGWKLLQRRRARTA